MAWNPFSDIERQLEEMRQRMLGTMGGGGAAGMPRGPEMPGPRVPTVDVIDERTQYEVTADLPGVDKDDIDINVDNHALTIRAEAREERRRGREEEGYLARERREMRFYRAIPLPEEVKTDGVRANYRNGVLHVTLPKKQPEERHGRRVRVE